MMMKTKQAYEFLKEQAIKVHAINNAMHRWTW